MQIKVLSLNIWRGEILENAIRFLQEENPDIILLQEVYDGKDASLPPAYQLFSVLQQKLKGYYVKYGAALCDITKYGDVEEGNAVFSKFPILSSKVTFFDIPYARFDNNAKTSFEDNPQIMLQATLDANGVELNAFSVHGVWGTHGEDNPRRLSMGKIIASQVHGKKNVIVGGDFNLNPNTKTIQTVEQELQSVFKDSLVSTFNMKHKKEPGYATAAVDMMFVSSNIQVIEKECVQVDVSDHLPLRVVLEV